MMTTHVNSPWAQGRMVAFDTETTGVDAENDRVVTAAVVAVGGGRPSDSRTWMADPGVEIPKQATAIHGVTTDQARAEGSDAAEVVEDITAALAEQLGAGVPVVVFNARYDLTLLDREARRHGVLPLVERLAGLDVAPVIDPLVLDRQIDRYRRGSRKLPALAAHYGVRHESAHTAEADALAAARIAWRIGTHHSRIGGAELLKLHDAQISWAAQQAAGLEEYLRRTDPEAYVEPAWPYLPHSLVGARREG
ncbi:exonuclease domain-containing protein [Streptomyces bathyalis]|nr:exonuclease domain-containing protein [Streptomyces bathyalis]